MLWQGSHPIAPGAQKVDFVADESYEVTPLPDFRCAQQGRLRRIWGAWAVKQPPKRIRKNFSLRSESRTNFMEYDLVYLRGDMLFWGAAISTAAALIRTEPPH